MRKPLLYSLKAKFVLISAVIVALFSVILGSSIVREEKAHLLQKLQENGRILMTSLKAPIINSIILGELGIQPGLLDNYVEEIVQSRELPARYAFITDDSGRVLAHSGAAQYGREVSRVRTPPPFKRWPVLRRPLPFKGSAGVRMGFSGATLQR